MHGISKRFGVTVALESVHLEVAAGEVCALVGENGAGKSTLMKVLSGALRPDAGRMTLGGHTFAPLDPSEARRRGVAMIYQELTLAPHLSVSENMFLGIELHRFGVLHRQRTRRRVREVLELLEHPEISPDEPVRRLSISAQQLVEVGRALVSDARVIIFDEPTSSLTRQDTERLFHVIRRLTSRGVAIIYISHFVEEVREISDHFTILRDGHTVAQGAIGDVSSGKIIEHMVGRSVDEMFPRVAHEVGDAVLELDGLCGMTMPVDAHLTLRRGEVLGVAGLVGSGRTELLRAIYGLDPVRSGDVRLVHVGDITGSRPSRSIRSGLGFLSENRKEEGLLVDLTIADNVALSDYRPLSRWGWISRWKQERAVLRWLEALGVRSRGPGQRVRDLSGGNQQKIAIARLLHQDADVFLFDEPTRGIDVGSKVQIYRLMGELAAKGKAILFVSSYLPELLGVTDRIAVMSRGRLGRARPVDELDEESIMRSATLGEDGSRS